MNTDLPIETLLSKYDARIPRYTSYPTAVELESGGFSHNELREILAGTTTSVAHSLYLHIPFCHSLCYFCACNKEISKDDDRRRRYVKALTQEIDLIYGLSGERIPMSSIHFGGGSPSTLDSADLGAIMGAITRSFTGFTEAQKSIELDPRTTSSALIAALRDATFTRASIGVQDFDPFVQDLVNRIQSFEMVRDVVRELRDSNFTSLNFDLIYGLPGQTPESFARTIEKVIELSPDRVAMFGYAHVTNKVKVQRVFDKYPLPSPLERYELYQLAQSMLKQADYVLIGLDHFAKNSDAMAMQAEAGTLKRNFMGYASPADERVLGFGASALSDTGEWLYQNEIRTDDYVAAIESGRVPVARKLQRTDEDRVRAALIERLMCDGKISSDLHADDPLCSAVMSDSQARLKELAQDGLIECSGGNIIVTEASRYFLRTVASAFDARLQNHKSDRFSRGV